MNSQPMVSIVTPLFNKADYFAETAKSVFSQSMTNFEWIVIDDGSTDGSSEILEKLDDSRLHKRANRTNNGPCASRNTGIDLAMGQWILFLDADDWIQQDHLENLLALGSDYDIITGGWIEKDVTLSNEGERKRPPLQAADFSIAFAPWAIHAAIIKKEHCPRWAENLDRQLAEDIHFWFLALSGKNIGFVNSCSAVYRKNTPDNRSSEHGLTNWYAGVCAAVDANLSHLEEPPSAKRAETIMRLHEGIWLRARREGNTIVERAAGKSAKKWLSAIAIQKLISSPSILARKILGLRMFHFFTTYQRSKKIQ